MNKYYIFFLFFAVLATDLYAQKILSGHVIDAKGAGIKDAEVRVLGTVGAKTIGKGFFQLDLTNTRYKVGDEINITVYHADYGRDECKRVISSGFNLQDIEIKSPKVIICGTIKNQEEAFIPGLKVYCTGSKDTLTTDRFGQFFFGIPDTELPPTKIITLSVAGGKDYTNWQGNIEVPLIKYKEQNVVLEEKKKRSP
jgi:hypothetical protein